jgi:hypothetical protein
MGIRGQDATVGGEWLRRFALTKGTAMNFTLADVFYAFGIVFFILASLYLLGANTMAVFN